MASAAEQLASNLNWGAIGKATELKKRLWFTVGALVVFRLGAYIPVPGVDPHALAEIFQQNAGGIAGLLDVFSGGSIGRMSVLALSIMPYISASIIMQILTTVVPSLEALKKEGEAGRKKINQYTRYGTVILAAFQAYGIAVGLESQSASMGPVVIDPGLFFRFVTVVTLVGGTLFLMWLGEQITARGVGNGVYGGGAPPLPLKITPAGFIPPIFASSLLLFPATIASFQGSAGEPGWVQWIATYLGHGQPLYLLSYIGLIVFFCFFYTTVVFNPVDTADNLKKNGGFVPGIRP